MTSNQSLHAMSAALGILGEFNAISRATHA